MHNPPELGPAVLDAVGVPVVVLDPDGRVLHFNRACEELSGYGRGALAGRTAWDTLLPAGEAERARAVFRDLVAGRGPATHRNDWIARDGSRIQIEWRNRVIRDGERVVAVVAAGAGLSAQRRAERALEDARRRTRAILDTAVDGVITIDPAGVIESLNPAAERLFGYRESELAGENVQALMPPPYREEHDGYLQRYLETGEKHIIGIGREVTGLRRDGSTFPMDLAVGEFEHDGRRYFAGVVRDVTDRHEYERELRQRLDEVAHLSRVTAIGELASGLAHEVNQPLAAIVSYAQACLRMLDAGHPPGEVMRRALEQIAAQGRRAGDIVQHLRRFMRQESIERSDTDLNAVVEEAAWLLEHETREHDIRLDLRLASGLPTIRAERTQLEQVVLNLMRNAIDALEGMPPERRRMECVTRLAQGDAGRAIEVRVADLGAGIPDADMERVFRPFFTTKEHGMGQGLPICRSIVRSHGGHIGVARNRPCGTRFTFAIPLTDDA